MYGIYANIGGILMANVTIYSIHGSYGVGCKWETMGNSRKIYGSIYGSIWENMAGELNFRWNIWGVLKACGIPKSPGLLFSTLIWSNRLDDLG